MRKVILRKLLAVVRIGATQWVDVGSSDTGKFSICDGEQ